ncbi:MAG: prepilin-type N-terminal cleavage/methylation domain-containing protein [Candidatus Omnitrophica bacterium]|nr:prepilin-type N-terminal cleavage/methylation domain-containing protein [Candidatus Omnitrophota bacterium]
MDKRGFTLAEIMTVVAILGIMAGLGLPRIFGKLEEARFSEGLSAAQAVYASQMRYSLDHGGAYSDDCSLLDLTVKTANFTNPPTCSSSNNPLVSLSRSNGAYTISVTYDSVNQKPVFSCPTCTANLKNILNAH